MSIETILTIALTALIVVVGLIIVLVLILLFRLARVVVRLGMAAFRRSSDEAEAEVAEPVGTTPPTDADSDDEAHRPFFARASSALAHLVSRSPSP